MRHPDAKGNEKFLGFLLVVAQFNHIRDVAGIGKSLSLNYLGSFSFAVWNSGKRFAEVENDGVFRGVFIKNVFEAGIAEFFNKCLDAFLFERFIQDPAGSAGIIDLGWIPVFFDVIYYKNFQKITYRGLKLLFH